MILSTSDRRRSILSGRLAPNLARAMDDLDRAEQLREEALGQMKAARGVVRTITDDIRHVGRCKELVCDRCGELLPTELE